MKIFALIPANGKGSRFGMPKVDAMYNGLTFENHLINCLKAAENTPFLIIKGMETPDMLASISQGVKQVLVQGIKPDGWLIFPVDHPLVKPETILALKAAFTTYPDSIIIPRYQDISGHPVIIPISVSLTNVSHPLGLKGIIRESGKFVRYLEVMDEGIIKNINTGEDIVYV